MRIRWTSLLLLIVVLSASACSQTTKDYWKTTKGYYYQYLNKSATIDIDDLGIYSTGEGYLAETLPPLERVLEKFDRTLFSLDKAPSDNWMYAFVNSYPWIGGVALVDVDGKVVHQWPSVGLEEYDYGFIKNDTANPALRHLIGHATESDFGPRVYVATQILKKAQPAGYFVVHFDPRSLFSHVPGSEEFMVAAPGALLWPGMFQVGATPLANVDWKTLTDDGLSGRISNANGTFVWYTLMVGTLPMVFAAPDEGSFPEEPGQLEMLASFRAIESKEAINMIAMPEIDETEADETEAGEGTVLAAPSTQKAKPVASESDIVEAEPSKESSSNPEKSVKDEPEQVSEPVASSE